MGRTPRDPEAAFTTFFVQGEPDECWPWQGGCRPNGYGRFRIRKLCVSTHRYAWQLHNGPIPDGLRILHTCDNPPCVNPGHLYAGTSSDNAKDRERRGRGRPTAGVDHHGARLTVAQVVVIRERHAAGATYLAVAEDFPVGPRAVGKIVRGERWPNAGGPIFPGRPVGRQPHHR